jgi:hypothetical protein
VVTSKYHEVSISAGVDLVLGLNGLVWVCPHVARGPDGAPVQPQTAAGAAAAAASITRAQREACVRVAGAIRALAALYLPIYPDAILDTHQVGRRGERGDFLLNRKTEMGW